MTFGTMLRGESDMQLRTWFRHCLTIACLVMLTFAEVQAQSSALGRIEEIRHDEGYVVIDGEEFTFSADRLEISLRGQPMRLVALQVGIYLRYTTAAGNEIVQIELIGPPHRLNELLNK